MLPLQYEHRVRQAQYDDLIREAEQVRLYRTASEHAFTALWAWLFGFICRLSLPFSEPACALEPTS